MFAVAFLVFSNVLQLGYIWAKHNKPTGNYYNAWTSTVSLVILMIIYWCTGMFDQFAIII